ncbi:MAG: hypothetical protein AAGG72_04465 [Pseudomonadota bacterium]
MDILAIKEASAPSDDGVWVSDDVHGLTGVRFHVLPSNSGTVSRHRDRSVLSFGGEMFDEEGKITDAGLDALNSDEAVSTRMSEVLLLGWDGLTSGGKPFPHSVESAKSMLESDVFWAAVDKSIAHATVQFNAARKALAKNSQKPSGKSSKAAE